MSHRTPTGGQGAGAEREGEGLAGDEAGKRGRGEVGEGFVCYFRSGVPFRKGYFRSAVPFRKGREGLRTGQPPPICSLRRALQQHQGLWAAGRREDENRGRKARLEVSANVQVRDPGSLNWHVKQTLWTGTLQIFVG